MFHEALQFAKMQVNITQRDIEVVLYSRKNILYCNKIPWLKKEKNAEICELIGIFMLSLIGKKYDSENAGLYHIVMMV